MNRMTKSDRLQLIVARHHARLLRQSQLQRKQRRVAVYDEPDGIDDIEVSSVETDDTVTIRGITKLAGPRIDD